MGDIKILKALSEPLRFELEPSDFGPDAITVRLEPGSAFSAAIDAGGGLSEAFVSFVLDAIQEWDLSVAGKPLECTPAMKRAIRPTLKRLLGLQIKNMGEDKDEEKERTRILGMALFEYLSDPQNFLKN